MEVGFHQSKHDLEEQMHHQSSLNSSNCRSVAEKFTDLKESNIMEWRGEDLQMKEKGRKEAGWRATTGAAGGAARSPEVGGQRPR